MDRQAKIERLKKTDKVSRAGVRVLGETSSCYELRFDETAQITETGEFQLFEFFPITSPDQLPAFRGRYDNGTNEIDTDIDFHCVTSLGEESKGRAIRDFKAMRNGFDGHHSRVVARFTQYKLQLRLNPAQFPTLRDGVVFDGEIILDRLNFEKHVTDTAKTEDSCSVRVEGNEITSR